MSQNGQRDELRALRYSLALSIVFTVAAFGIAFLTDSETMTLEALAGLVDVAVSVLAIYVAGKVREPANERYNFGYAKYEPLMIGMEGALIATVCLSSIASAVRDILHPDPVEGSGLVAGYALVGFALSLGFGLYMRHLGRRAQSPLVEAESQLWIIDGWLSLGVGLAFVAAIVLSRTERFDYSAYVDPAVCIVLSVILLKKPLEILKESFLDLVDASPYAETRSTIEEAARECVPRYGLRGLDSVRLRKAGRRLFVVVSFLEGPHKPLEEMDRARSGIVEDLSRVNPDVDVSVLFRSG